MDTPEQRLLAGRVAGGFMIVGGLLTMVNSFLHVLGTAATTDEDAARLMGALAVATGVCVVSLPWQRWPLRATIVLFPVGVACWRPPTWPSPTGRGPDTAYYYPIYYVLLVVWLGLAHPRRTSLYVAPVAAIGYAVPLAFGVAHPPSAVHSVTFAIARLRARWARRSRGPWTGSAGPEPSTPSMLDLENLSAGVARLQAEVDRERAGQVVVETAAVGLCTGPGDPAAAGSPTASRSRSPPTATTTGPGPYPAGVSLASRCGGTSQVGAAR